MNARKCNFSFCIFQIRKQTDRENVAFSNVPSFQMYHIVFLSLPIKSSRYMPGSDSSCWVLRWADKQGLVSP